MEQMLLFLFVELGVTTSKKVLWKVMKGIVQVNGEKKKKIEIGQIGRTSCPMVVG